MTTRRHDKFWKMPDWRMNCGRMTDWLSNSSIRYPFELGIKRPLSRRCREWSFGFDVRCPGNHGRMVAKLISAPHADTTEDGFLGGALRLRQPRSGHRAGHDAVLLAAATSARGGDRVVEFGAGVGAAGLALARRIRSIELMLVEIDPELAELARGNAALNAISADVVVLDVTSGAEAFSAAGLTPDSVDVVLMNPPFNDAARHRPSPVHARTLAHRADETTLQGWIHSARRILKSGGTLTLIWRADEL